MTTTLRPSGPEERRADGARTRAYDICVNSRPVGLVELSTDGRAGPVAGRIVRLSVDRGERRRGRGTVAALAAEEVLRGWGCRRVEASVAEGAVPAQRLAEALGYLPRSRNMLKDLTGEPPELPRGSVVRTMTDAEFDVWRSRDRDVQIRLLTARGVTREEAAAQAAAAHRSHLPDGPSTAGAALRVLEHEGEPVGTLWVTPASAPREDADAWVYGVETAEERRGEGHGRTLLLAAEREAHAAGSRVLGLNVHSDNVPALGLYSSLGYRTVEHHLYKTLL
ncbi:GNAT family N-acetyltransferase [Streptomyces sp. ODS28]|uniref:GNAT family N-acetyltransferase n=1 Tax=Streptomyces sp. ODS28 TaxID=3136688 RepID=UPI0031E687D4